MGSPKPKLQTLDFEQFNESEGNTLSKKERETLNELKTVVDSGEYSIAVDPMSQTYKLVNKKGNTYTEQTGLKVKGDLAQRVFGGDRKRTSALVGRMIEGNYMKSGNTEEANLPAQATDAVPAAGSPKPPLKPTTDTPTNTPSTPPADAPVVKTQEQINADIVEWRQKIADEKAAKDQAIKDEQAKKAAELRSGLDNSIYGGYPGLEVPRFITPDADEKITDPNELLNSLGVGATVAAGAVLAVPTVAGVRRASAQAFMNPANPKYGPWRTTLQSDKGVTKLMDKTAAKLAATTDPVKAATLQTKYDALKGQLAENRPFTKASVKKATEVIAEQTKKIDEVLDAKIAVAASSKPALATLDLKQIANLEEQIADLRIAAKGTSTRMVADTPEIKALSDKLKLLRSTIKTSADRVDLLNFTGALQADKATAKPIFEAAEEVIKARKLAPITPKFINSVLRGNAKAGKPILQYLSKII